MDRYLRLLEVYSLEEIFEHLELEPSEVLEILENYGYDITLEEPL